MDNPDYWRTIKDKWTGEEVVLSDEQLDLIQRLQKSSYPEVTVDPYEVCGGCSWQQVSQLLSCSVAICGSLH